jgi:hypothetical protein
MARNFLKASSQWIDVNAPDLSSQITICAWVKQTTIQSGNFPNGYFILSRQIAGATFSINYNIFFRSGNFIFEWTPSSGVYLSVPGIAHSADTDWHHYCAAINWASGQYTLALDGIVTTGTFTPSTPQTSSSYVTYVGRQGNSGSGAEFMNGDIAELAIWDKKILDSEITSLGKGYDPSLVRPQNLVRYWPLRRDLNEIRAGTTLTNNGTTISDHPRIYA